MTVFANGFGIELLKVLMTFSEEISRKSYIFLLLLSKLNIFEPVSVNIITIVAHFVLLLNIF